ncbi:MAG: hypothetical protein ACR2OF_00080 [Hyphomicrobium sp.]
MSRTIVAIATAFFAVMTVFASAAEACISCEHVPVVARSSSTSYQAKRYKKKRFHARATARAKARARARAIAAARVKAKARAIAAAKAKAKARAVAAARAKAKARAIAAARAKAKARAVAAARAKAKAKAIAAAEAAAGEEVELAETTDSENSTISTSIEVAETEVDETEKVAAVSEDLGCKKFFPTVGMTLTVPCE